MANAKLKIKLHNNINTLTTTALFDGKNTFDTNTRTIYDLFDINTYLENSYSEIDTTDPNVSDISFHPIFAHALQFLINPTLIFTVASLSAVFQNFTPFWTDIFLNYT